VVNWEGCGKNTYCQQRYRNLHDALASANIEIRVSLTTGNDHLYIKPIDCGNNSLYHLQRQPPTLSLNNNIKIKEVRCFCCFMLL
jgi:hypothetical protein